MRERHPRIGNLLLKLQDAPEHEKAWATGATGEEELAAFLSRRCPDVTVLHDRRMPRSRANIDLLRTLSIRGHSLFYPRRLAKRLNEPGDLGQGQIQVIAAALAQRFLPA